MSVSAPLPLFAQGTRVTPQPQDLGPTNASQTVTASLVLKVRHPDLLEAYVASTQDPNSPSYHRFLSLPSFSLPSRPLPPTFLSFGISALLAQATGGGRLGLWNPMLYRFQQIYGYSNASPFVDITAGDNWFYHGIPGYEPGAGLGVLDVTKLAAAVARDSQPGYPPHKNAP